MADSDPTTQHVAMTDDDILYQEEAAIMEKRGRRLRRAALTAGVMQSISLICTIYTTIAIRWRMIEWMEPERTAYQIQDNMALFKFGIVCDAAGSVADTFIGVLLGLILIGAGVNPASSSLIIVFKIMAQVVMAISIVFMIVAGIFVDENISLYSTIQNYFYSQNTFAIGTQMAYLMLVINKYGYVFAQIFSGVHYTLLGFTIVMWGVFPRWMGYMIAVSGPCLLLSSTLHVLSSEYDGEFGMILQIPMLLSEFWLAGWMLVNTPHPAKNRDLYLAGYFRDEDGGKRTPIA